MEKNLKFIHLSIEPLEAKSSINIKNKVGNVISKGAIDERMTSAKKLLISGHCFLHLFLDYCN